MVKIIQASLLLIEVHIINPAIRFIELVKFSNALFKHFGIEEIFEYNMRIRIRALVLAADFG